VAEVKATNQRTMAALDLTTAMTDALSLGRQGVGVGDPQLMTAAENQLRRIQSKTLDYLPQDDLGSNPLAEAHKQCEEEIDEQSTAP
jgi:hypothetical protein